MAQLLTEHEVAEMLRLSVQTLRNWRMDNTGIPFVKLGKSVRYRKEDVDAHIQSCVKGGGK